MKSSVSPTVAAIAIALALVLAGLFAFRTLGTKSKASEDLGKNADLSALSNMSDQDKDKMKQELENAKLKRDEVTR